MAQGAHSRLWSVTARAGIILAGLGLFLFLRPDWSGKLWRRIGAPKLIADYLHSNKIRKLQIGAGSNNVQGWLNTDIEPQEGQVYLDATRRFPFEERSLNYILSEHVIEHLDYEKGLWMLKECYRVLVPGGKVRIATPNLVRFTGLLQEQRSAEIQRFVERKLEVHEWPLTPDPECYIINLEMREFGHRFIYTPKMLKAILEITGFGDVREFRPGESDDPELTGMEHRPKTPYGDVNAYETMVFQAVRK